MKLGAKLGIAGGGIVAIIVLMVFVMNISYQNSFNRIDQDITVYQHRGGPRTRADTATTTKHANSHNEGSLELRLMG